MYLFYQKQIRFQGNPPQIQDKPNQYSKLPYPKVKLNPPKIQGNPPKIQGRQTQYSRLTNLKFKISRPKIQRKLTGVSSAVYKEIALMFRLVRTFLALEDLGE